MVNKHRRTFSISILLLGMQANNIMSSYYHKSTRVAKMKNTDNTCADNSVEWLKLLHIAVACGHARWCSHFRKTVWWFDSSVLTQEKWTYISTQTYICDWSL